MKDLLNNLKDFLEYKVLDDKNILVLSNFYLKDTSNMYPINIKKMDNEYFIHDGGSLIMFLNENETTIDRNKIAGLIKENPSFSVVNNNILIYKTYIDSINEDIAKYIQIITKIAD